MVPHEGHKYAGRYLLFLNLLPAAGYFIEGLGVTGAYRDDQAAPISQLGKKSLGNLGSPGSDNDPFERGSFGPPFRPIFVKKRDVTIPEGMEDPLSSLD